MLLSALFLGAFSTSGVDLVLNPGYQSAAIGSTVEITLTASSTRAQSISGIDAILSWDPARLDFVEADASAYPWFVAGFLTDPDGINLDVTDGEALYTLLASPGVPATVPPDLDAVIFRFKVLSSGQVSLLTTSGTFGKTRVLANAPNVEITGDTSAIASVNAPIDYCTAGTSKSGCSVILASAGTPSASATSGFSLIAAAVEGSKNGTFYFGTNGRQANPWGNGTSYQCVVPPVIRTGLQMGIGTTGFCDGFFTIDLNALWCTTCPKPAKNPGPGAIVQSQLWYRDPFNTSNQTTTLSNALEFLVGP